MDYLLNSFHNSRKAVLASYNLAKTTEIDEDYDQITYLATTITKAPVAYLSILGTDEIWFKATCGIELSKSIPIENSFLNNLLESNQDFFTLNFSENPELFKNAEDNFGKKFRFYTGLPIKDENGFLIGVLNILDDKERELEAHQIKGLKALANQTLKLLEFRRQNCKFEKIQKNLKGKYQDLEKFTSLVSHDIKSPLANIISLTELLREENKETLGKDSRQYLDYLVESSYALRDYVDGILSFYRSEHLLTKKFENVDLAQILKGIQKLYDVEEEIEINYPTDITLHNVNKAALYQIFLNLIGNALKYNTKQIRKVTIAFKELEDFYQFQVLDNGDGFHEKDATKIFELFTTLEHNDRKGNPGSGIGLATVKKLVNNLGGNISVRSVPDEGSTFCFTIKRL